MNRPERILNGARVYHVAQIWARTLPGGTGYVLRSEGPDHRGNYEYLVLTGEDFSRRTGPDNPEHHAVWWPSDHIRRAYTA